MQKLTYIITEGDRTYGMEFITDRTPSFTENQYMRHRANCTMNLIGEEPTEETQGQSNEFEI
jgi:serine/threonine protein kinase HipA of HipAB toxin-antitoxin module